MAMVIVTAIVLTTQLLGASGIRCVQCGSNCNIVTTATECPPFIDYCYSTQTWTINTTTGERGTSLDITKGCQSNFPTSDECSITLQSSTLLSYQCRAICDTDGCNLGLEPNGQVDVIPLSCVQCSGISCQYSSLYQRTVCPQTAKYCKSTVSYYQSDKNDVPYDTGPAAFAIINVTRECSVDPVVRQCTQQETGLPNLVNVICQETCNVDGCNTGWPARPKCSRCDSPTPANSSYDLCLKNPPLPTSCIFPYDKYCIISDNGQEKNTRDSVEGYTRRIRRNCSAYSIGNSCSEKIIRDVTVQVCNKTCDSDGCNYGSGSASIYPPREWLFLYVGAMAWIYTTWIQCSTSTI